MAQVIDAQGKVVREGSRRPPCSAATSPRKSNAVFRAVFRELANPRAGTASTKKRDEVRGGGKKPWRQKGTGRARQGSTRSPQWAHGGVVFGPQPRSYVSSLNKKERRAALLGRALRQVPERQRDRARHDRARRGQDQGLRDAAVRLAQGGPAPAPARWSCSRPPSWPRSAPRRAGANLERVAVTHTGELNIKDVVGYARLVLTTGAHDALVGKYAQESK